jgi:hypothetical protein
MKRKHEEQDTAIDGLTECLLKVTSGRSIAYHANVRFRAFSGRSVGSAGVICTYRHRIELNDICLHRHNSLPVITSLDQSRQLFGSNVTRRRFD